LKNSIGFCTTFGLLAIVGATAGAAMAQDKVLPGRQSKTGILSPQAQVGQKNTAIFPGASLAGSGKAQSGPVVLPQPRNGSDSCATATPISGASGTDATSTIGATHDGATTCGASGTSPDVWYDWTSPGTGSETFSFCPAQGGSATYDSVLGAFSACGGAQLACNDDTCGLASSITFAVTSGTHYFICVSGFFNATGTGVLGWAGSFGGPPANDECSGATVITGHGPFAFDSTLATTSGPDNAICTFFGTPVIAHDLWYRWTADCNPGQRARVFTCAQTAVDTKVAIYTGPNCPVDDSTIVACNDDSCALQSSVEWDPTPGTQYIIRLGAYPFATGGQGTFTIECNDIIPLSCTADQATQCQGRSLTNAYNMTNFLIAEDFNPAASGSITNICWYGVYFNNTPVPDNVQITFYSSNNGLPDQSAVIDQFVQGVDMAVTGPAPDGIILFGRNEMEFTATFSRPVAVTAGTCIWVEIQNYCTGDSFFWTQSDGSNGNTHAVQDGNLNGLYECSDTIQIDLAICYNLAIGDGSICAPPPPPNNDCANAQAVGEGTFDYSTCGATTDGAITCGAGGSDVWYDYTASDNGLAVFSTCTLTTQDTVLSRFDTCGGTDIQCLDDFCGLQTQISWNATAGTHYLLNLAGFVGGTGAGQFSIALLPPCVLVPPASAITEPEPCDSTIPPNDTVDGGCNSTPPVFLPILCGQSYAGTAWADQNWRDTDWYEIQISVPTTLTLTGSAEFPLRLFILDGNCPPAVLATANGGLPCDVVTISTSVTPGIYRFFAGDNGFAGNPCDSGSNDYWITLTADICPQPIVGRCCLSQSCSIMTPAACQQAGGVYGGDGSTCPGGIPGPAGDDVGATVPLGFSFTFFGNTYTDIQIGSNGVMSFNLADFLTFVNDVIPSPLVPNNLVCPYWDDWRTDTGGHMYYQTLGTAGSHRFVCQWQDVQHFNGTGPSTFEAILYEGTNDVEFRYGSLSPNSPSIGVENADGSAGTSINPGTIGTCQHLTFVGGAYVATSCQNAFEDIRPGGPCPNLCPCDFNHSGSVNSQDFFDFLNCFFSATPLACGADFNNSGSVNSQDFFDFLNCFFNHPPGCN
jgi:hypothetical protein